MAADAHPYSSLPRRSFWRPAVASLPPSEWSELYRKRFAITPRMRISAAGSCFAQYIGHQLKTRHFAFLDLEPAPPLLPADKHAEYGYGLFSARFGNVYTARQLLQLLQRAYGKLKPADGVWQQNGRYFDPFRPSIEPGGFDSLEELIALRESHLAAVRRMIAKSEVFIFTLGLTEAWTCKDDGAVYPMCPGTIAGRFDPQRHVFQNFSYKDVYRDLSAVIRITRRRNPQLRFLLTVSPIPLTATASDQHVLTATTYSKSVLRAVAGDLYREHDFVDYFPSYEIVMAPATGGQYFEANMRSVTPAGVEAVMSRFFSEHGAADVITAPIVSAEAAAIRSQRRRERRRAEIALVCDEEKLDVTVR